LRFACGCQFDRNEDGGINFSVDWDALNYDCPETWALLSAGNTQGVFQLESRFGQQTCKKAPIANIDELSNVVAALRPGCTQSYLEDGVTLSDHYLKRRAGDEEANPFHPALEPILRGTQQISIYQEDILFISQEVAGFTAGEAYALMKGIAKKKPEIIAEFTQKFAEGCAKVGKVNKEEAEKIFEWIRAAQRYGFCKCLLSNYSLLSLSPDQ
jgi:DNA polymerase-3 subunit alpha